MFFNFSSGIIKSSADKAVFLKEFKRRPGLHDIDSDWFDRHQAIGIYYGDQLVGGFIEERFPFSRTLDVISDVTSYLEGHCGPGADVFAVSSFWIGSHICSSRLLSFYSWFTLWRFICSKPRTSFALFGSDHSKLNGIYRMIGTSCIYEGPALDNPQESSAVFLARLNTQIRVRFAMFVLRWSVRRLLTNFFKYQNIRAAIRDYGSFLLGRKSAEVNDDA